MSKKIIAILCAAFMIFGTGLTAYAVNPPVISVGEAKAIKGSTIEVPVSLENNTGFSAISVELNFNRDVLTLVNVKAPAGVKISMKSQYYYNEPYVIKWIYSPDICELNGEMAILVFEVADDAEVGDYPISIDYYKGPTGKWVDGVDTNVVQNGNVTTALGLTYKNGKVTVYEEPVISVGEAKAMKGNTVEVPVSLRNNTGFSDISVELDYNKNVLTLVDIKSTLGVEISDMSITYNDNKPYIQWTYLPDKSEFNGEMAILVFEIADNAEPGDYAVSVDYYKGLDGELVDGTDTNFVYDGYSITPLGLSYENGKVTVIGPKTVSVNAGGKSGSCGIEVMNGMVIVTLYNDANKQIDIKIFDAAEDAFEFVSDKTATYAGIMCWEKTDTELKPVLDKIELTLN